MKRSEGDKNYLIALEVRNVASNQSVQGSEGSFFFSINQTKVQILDYRQTTRKVNGLGVLFPSSSKQRGRLGPSQIAGWRGTVSGQSLTK